MLLLLFFHYFITVFYTVYKNKVFRGNYAPLQIGVVVVVNDFWTHALTSNVLKIYFREHVLQFYQGQATFSKDLLSTPAASVVRTVVK